MQNGEIKTNIWKLMNENNVLQFYMRDDKYISYKAHANIPNITTEKIEMVSIVIYCVMSKCFTLSTKKQCYFVYLKTQILAIPQNLQQCLIFCCQNKSLSYYLNVHFVFNLMTGRFFFMIAVYYFYYWKICVVSLYCMKEYVSIVLCDN